MLAPADGRRQDARTPRATHRATVMRKSGRANLDAMLRHLASHHDPQDFPSTAYERQALLEAAGKRRLIEWQKDNRRYELTPIGWRRLRRGGGLGFSLGIGLGAVATIGAAALLWLPGDRSAQEKAAVAPQAQKIGARDPAPPPAGPSPIVPTLVRDTAPVIAPDRPAPPARVADRPAEPAGTADRPVEPARVADAPADPAGVTEQPAAQPPDGDAAAAKDPGEKRSRHRTGRAHRRWGWAFARRYRDERYAGAGR